MTTPKSWILTDVDKNLWRDNLFLEHEELGVPDCTVSKQTLRGGLRDGVEVVEVTNGDLSFSILPTRGMGIWKGQYRGMALGWKAPVNGPVHPKFVNLQDRGGLGWLQGFDEWVVRCGLDSNGAPGEDVVVDNNGNPMTVNLTLHGKIANLPCHHLEIQADSESKTVSVIGQVDESALFCPGLRLKTTITTAPVSNRLTLVDEISNLKAVPSELELLYHCNFGEPFLEAGSTLIAPISEVAPRDRRAAEGVIGIDTYSPPTSGYVEQVYFYDLTENQAHQTLVALRNASGDKAVALRFNRAQLPCFTQWKNTAALADGYVTGLEPGTNYPNRKRFEREKGRVIRVEPGKGYRCELTFEICDSREQVVKIEAEVAKLQAGLKPTVHQQPYPKFSPQ
jgi:Domain of unknown function (DUF4432)